MAILNNHLMRVLWIGGFGLKSLNDNNTSGYNGGGWLASLKKEIIKYKS